jgi:beta-ureidopropionase
VIEPFTAVAIQADVYDSKTRIEDKPDCRKNLSILSGIIDMAYKQASLEFPVRLLGLPEGAIIGYPDSLRNWDHVQFAKSGAIDVPGEETDSLAAKARQLGVYIMAQSKARDEIIKKHWPERFFNLTFIIDPKGRIIHKQYKNLMWVRELSCTPHDVYDEWTKVFGDGIDAFFPVAKTDIGNIATTCCMDGSFPEVSRGFALNGGEIFYRPSYPEPWVADGTFELQNRAHAMFNNMYVIGPNNARHFSDLQEGPGFFLGGKSHIIDYKGKVMAQTTETGNTFVAATIDVEQLRKYRTTAKFMNWLPYLKTEVFKTIYEKSIWPMNCCIEKIHDQKELDERYSKVVKKLVQDGIFAPPST